MEKEPTFAGEWTELTPKRGTRWYFPPDGRGWEHDTYDYTLYIHHINRPDDLYVVRRLLDNVATLTNPVDCRVTLLQR